MIYTPLTKKAISLAYSAHFGQVDKAGYPYILHPLYLAEQISTEDETIVAILHDVVEDTCVTFRDLEIRFGFSKKIVDTLQLLTRDKGISYDN